MRSQVDSMTIEEEDAFFAVPVEVSASIQFLAKRGHRVREPNMNCDGAMMWWNNGY